MSYHDPLFLSTYGGAINTKSPKVELEVLLLEKEEKHLRIKVDETAPPRWIARRGIRIINERTPYATLEMAEAKALNLNLV